MGWETADLSKGCSSKLVFSFHIFGWSLIYLFENPRARYLKMVFKRLHGSFLTRPAHHVVHLYKPAAFLKKLLNLLPLSASRPHCCHQLPHCCWSISMLIGVPGILLQPVMVMVFNLSLWPALNSWGSHPTSYFWCKSCNILAIVRTATWGQSYISSVT